MDCEEPVIPKTTFCVLGQYSHLYNGYYKNNTSLKNNSRTLHQMYSHQRDFLTNYLY